MMGRRDRGPPREGLIRKGMKAVAGRVGKNLAPTHSRLAQALPL